MRGLRVFGHPLHAVLSDVPVGLLGTSLVWDAVGLWRGEPVWWAVSFWCIALGLAAAAAAATAGFVDYVALRQDDPAQATATRHMLFILGALAPYAASLAVRGGPAPPTGKGVAGALVLEALGLLLLSVGGWYGGHLVFHHGVGRDGRGGG
ncbi:MAG TPA: DUF2231 domain-containing protein [Pyrinomonadaceae bacterium]|nr:DUF2231 domain-containing protein [Pyrinomonadaceae bacterium]